MKVRHVLTTLLTTGVLLGSSACGALPDPCRNVSVPNQEALAQFASDNPQIEIEAEGERGTECVLTGGGNWVDESQIEDDEDD